MDYPNRRARIISGHASIQEAQDFIRLVDELRAACLIEHDTNHPYPYPDCGCETCVVLGVTDYNAALASSSKDASDPS